MYPLQFISGRFLFFLVTSVLWLRHSLPGHFSQSSPDHFSSYLFSSFLTSSFHSPGHFVFTCSFHLYPVISIFTWSVYSLPNHFNPYVPTSIDTWSLQSSPAYIILYLFTSYSNQSLRFSPGHFSAYSFSSVFIWSLHSPGHLSLCLLTLSLPDHFRLYRSFYSSCTHFN